MFTTISDFLEEWNAEASSTQKVLDALTDQSLSQQVSTAGRDLGRIAWHNVMCIPEFLALFGIANDSVKDVDNVPISAKDIADTFRKVASNTENAVRQHLTDVSLKEVQNVFGRNLTKGATLLLILKHMIHHRGQMTVLMRQAGLKVPGVYGPALEEWNQIGQEPPKI